MESKVTSVCANALPYSVAPVFITIAVWQRMIPLNWEVVPSVVWPATGFDNQVNVLGGTVMAAMNEFIGPKCDEIKDLLTTD